MFNLVYYNTNVILLQIVALLIRTSTVRLGRALHLLVTDASSEALTLLIRTARKLSVVFPNEQIWHDAIVYQDENAHICVRCFKIMSEKGGDEGLAPKTGSLLYAVDCFQKLTHVVLFSRHHESFGLGHKNWFVDIRVQKRCGHVKLKRFVSERCGES